MKYTEAKSHDYDDTDEEGRRIHGYVTREVSGNDPLYQALREHIGLDQYPYFHSKVLLTTEECWSGYSEYTVTNQWSEIVVTVPEQDYEKHWDSLSEFLIDISETSVAKNKER